MSIRIVREVSDPAAPSLATRLEALKTKAESEGYELEDNVALYLVANLDWDERLIDGALRRVHEYTRLRGLPITVENARHALKEVLEAAGIRRIPILIWSAE